MITLPAADQRAYIARMARETGATLYAIGASRGEARRRLIAALEDEFGRQYARDEAASSADHYQSTEE